MKSPDPRIKPPLGSYIDWSHPLAEGLVGCWLFNEWSGKIIDLVDNSLPTDQTMKWGADCLLGDDASYSSFAYKERYNVQEKFTLLVEGKFHDNTDGCLVAMHSAGNTYRPAYGIDKLYGNHPVEVSLRDSSGNNLDSFLSVPDDYKNHTYIVHFLSGTYGKLYRDGLLVDEETSSVPSALDISDGCRLSFGGFAAGSNLPSNRLLNGHVRRCLLYKKIKDQEWLYYEPYAFIAWPSHTTIFDLGAGGGTSLTCDNISHSQFIANPALTQLQALLTGNVVQDQAIGSPSLSQIQNLDTANILQGQEVDALSLSQLHNIDPGNVAQSQAVSLINLLQNSTVTVNAASQAQSIESPSLAQIAELITSSINQAQFIDNIEITIQGGLSIYSVGQNQTVNSLGIAQVISLVTNTVSQAQSVDSLTITLTGGLSIDNLTQDQSIGALTLAQVIALTINQIAQAQNIDHVNLATNFVLDINGVTTSQTLSGPVTLSQISEILTSDLLQGQTITSISFSGVKGIVTVTFKAKTPKVEFKPKGSSTSFN